MSNILNHNRKVFTFKVSKSDYWDMHLYLKQYGGNLADMFQDDCLASYIDTAMDECLLENGLVSMDTYRWENAINKGVSLTNIGLTGVDNGLLTYDKDTITQEEFDDIYQNSVLETGVDDMKLYLNKVAGNNKIYSYGNEIVKENGINVSKLNGGFYQGFFQTDTGCEYRVLPSKLGNGWTMEFVFKPIFDGSVPSGSEEKLPTLNDVYPENKGIFFYIGTRAENKWWKYYNSDDSASGSNVFTTDLTTDSGLRLDTYDTVVDINNKFVTYNRSKNGLLACDEHTDDEYARILFDEKNFGENYYLYVNRSKDGYTVETIGDLKTDKTKKYDILKDLFRNALAFQVKEDGKIGYKYMVQDCEAEKGYAIEEEWSYEERIKVGEWNHVAVRFIPFLPKDSIPYNKKADLMRLIFYVNGKIVLYSKPMPTLLLRVLNDVYEKQEGVPYNISIGGGTQGLCDVVYGLDSTPEDLLFLEKEFGGSLEGYFKVFRFHSCDLNYEQIYQNYRLEKQLRWI